MTHNYLPSDRGGSRRRYVAPESEGIPFLPERNFCDSIKLKPVEEEDLEWDE